MCSSIEVIGIDHGWSMIKTVNHVFVTGVKQLSKEPALSNDVVECNGRYYVVDGKRLEVRNTKVENENFYILTLAAVAKELRLRGKQKAKVFLAAGLPITRFGDEKEDFLKYLKANERVDFKFEGVPYSIEVTGAAVFPQCYAAVLDKIQTFSQKVFIVDIGSWTIDIMPIENKKPVNGECSTIPNGLITCMRNVNERCYSQLGEEVDESIIQRVMKDEDAEIDGEFLEVIKEGICSYADSVFNSLREYKINLRTSQIVFAGGGAEVMKRFGGISQRNISYITDVKANAKGFEMLGKVALKKTAEKVG